MPGVGVPAPTCRHGCQEASLPSCGPGVVKSGKRVLSSGALGPEGAAETVPTRDRLGGGRFWLQERVTLRADVTKDVLLLLGELGTDEVDDKTEQGLEPGWALSSRPLCFRWPLAADTFAGPDGRGRIRPGMV